MRGCFGVRVCPKRADRQQRERGVTVFIVEDDPGVGDALGLLLRSLGHDVCVYGDAESFLATGQPASGDTVIVDLVLPGISGADLVRRLQKTPSPPRIAVISGQPQGAIDNQLRGMDVQHLLRKPLSEESISSVLN